MANSQSNNKQNNNKHNHKGNKNQGNKHQDKKANLGLTATKEAGFSEWFTQLIQKSEMIDYSPVSGCYILRPRSYFIWEQMKEVFDKMIKEDGVQNAYFPLLIPESYLKKEEEHVEGFAPEVAWVETGGNTKLKERLAVRPTSETIMYESYSKWIRSYKDLPLRLNQWGNVVRWEFKHCTPFLRTREFLWHEGHTAFATKKEAIDEAKKILNMYEHVFKTLLAIPSLAGEKSEKERFAGADNTFSLESVMPDGKAIQGCTSHHLGQNFAKAFNIKYKDKDGQEKLVYQNSWAFTTRAIGMALLLHSDDKGLVLPPKVAQTQVIIVPLLFKNKEEPVLKAANKIKEELKAKGIRVRIDDRTNHSAGYKYNEWELKGIPIRIEIGPRDLDNNQAMLKRRDKDDKEAIPLDKLTKATKTNLNRIQRDLYKKAKQNLNKSIVKVRTKNSVIKAINKGKIALVPWCGSKDSESKFKEETGIKSLNAPFDQPDLKNEVCFLTKEKATKWYYFGKSY